MHSHGCRHASSSTSEGGGGGLVANGGSDDVDQFPSPSVRDVVACFEHQKRQTRGSPAPRDRPAPAAKSTAAKVKAAHMRTTSEDLTKVIRTFSREDGGRMGSLVSGDGNLLDSQRRGKSVAELRAALQRSAADGSFSSTSEQDDIDGLDSSSKRRSFGSGNNSSVDVEFRPISELKDSLRKSFESLDSSSDGEGSSGRLAASAVAGSASAVTPTNPNTGRPTAAARKPPPKVFPKPRGPGNVKAGVGRCERTHSLGEELEVENERPRSTRPAPAATQQSHPGHTIDDVGYFSLPSQRHCSRQFETEKIRGQSSSMLLISDIDDIDNRRRDETPSGRAEADATSPSSTVQNEHHPCQRESELSPCLSLQSSFALSSPHTVCDTNSILVSVTVSPQSAATLCPSPLSTCCPRGGFDEVDSVCYSDSFSSSVTSDSWKESSVTSPDPNSSSYSAAEYTGSAATHSSSSFRGDVADRPAATLLMTSQPEGHDDEVCAQFVDHMRTAFGGDVDRKLCQVVCESRTCRTALDYVAELFPPEMIRSVQRYRPDLQQMFGADVSTGDECVQFLSVDSLKEAVLQSLLTKRDSLRIAKQSAETELGVIKQLEKQVKSSVMSRTDAKQSDKCVQCLRDLDQVTHLLLMLAARLARHDQQTAASNCNCCFTAAASPATAAPSGESHRHQQATKRVGIVDKFNDATLLKADIDHRCRSLSAQLASCLTDIELAEYRRLLADKTRVVLQLREVEDWTRLTEELVRTLRSSVEEMTLSASQC